MLCLTPVLPTCVLQMDRDTQKCAFKCSHLEMTDGSSRVVFKVTVEARACLLILPLTSVGCRTL